MDFWTASEAKLREYYLTHIWETGKPKVIWCLLNRETLQKGYIEFVTDQDGDLFRIERHSEPVRLVGWDDDPLAGVRL